MLVTLELYLNNVKYQLFKKNYFPNFRSQNCTFYLQGQHPYLVSYESFSFFLNKISDTSHSGNERALPLELTVQNSV